MPLDRLVDFGLGGFILGAKTTFLVHLPYLLNHLKFSAHILTKVRTVAEPVNLRGLIDFGLVGSIFGVKNYVFGTFAISLEPLEVQFSDLKLVPLGVSSISG